MTFNIKFFMPEDPKPFLAERLEYLRLEKGLTQKQLAQHLGMSASMLSKYEKGKSHPNDIQLNKIAQYFNVSVDYLLGNTNVVVSSDAIKDIDKNYVYIPSELRSSSEAISMVSKFIEILTFYYSNKPKKK